MVNIYEYYSYKTYLKTVLGGHGQRTGKKSELARAMGCQTSYLSQVLNGTANISLEQAQVLNEHFGHDREAQDFFLMLVQKERAGSVKLRDHFANRIAEVIEKRRLIRNRVQFATDLPLVDQARYYSQWYYACIHVLLSIPELQTKEALADKLGLPLKIVSEVVEFLDSRGLAVSEGGRHKIGPRHLHLAEDSPLVGKHHTDWRTRAMVALGDQKQQDMHYTVVWTLSREDAVKIRQRLVDLIESNLKLIGPSKEECAYAFTLDFFEI